MHEFAFDITLRVSLRVGAYTEEGARAQLKEVLDCAEANLGKWPDTDELILCEASIDGDPKLFEVDGEPAPGATMFHADLLPEPEKCVKLVKELANEESVLKYDEGDSSDDEELGLIYEHKGYVEEARRLCGLPEIEREETDEEA